jgi:thiosulfate dehydrogenase [quinone] large subunit
MSDERAGGLTRVQQVALVLLRTLVGWHFLYEGYYKVMLPGWSAEGQPLGRWSSAGYLRSATEPLGGLLRRALDAGWGPWIDRSVEAGLILAGASLILGLFTRLGCWGAFILLSLFYVSSIPTSGTPQTGAEGAYLIVNKNLIELAAVAVLLVFRTGEIAGLDLLWRSKPRSEAVVEASETG